MNENCDNNEPRNRTKYVYDNAAYSNPIGRLTHASNNVNAGAYFNYDPMGRLKQSSYCTPQNCNYTNAVSAVYDLAGDLTYLTYPDGRNIVQSFDSVGRLASVTGGGTNYLTVSGYDPPGHMTSATMGSGTLISAGYNPRLEIGSLAYGPSSSPVWSKQYSWTLNGNLQQAVDTVAGTTRKFGFDTLNRIASAQDVYTGTQNQVPNGIYETYNPDPFGNLQKSGNFSFLPPGGYNTANQPLPSTDWSYDAAGNLLSDGLGNSYTWDANGMILSATGINYYYDAQGNRVGKSGTPPTDSIYFGGHPVARLIGGAWTDLIYGVGGLLAEVPNTGPVYRMTNNLGSSVGLLSSTGALVGSIQDYAPFGELFNGSNTTDPYKFTGKERDAESGLDYFKYRMYASSMGRWMSPDPSGLTHVDLGNPQELNLYNYVGNNPLTRTDLDGLCIKGFQWACNAVQALDNGFHGLGFQTNASVDREQHTANQTLHHDGVQTEGLSRRQVRKAYRLDMALGSVRSEGDDGFTYATRIRPTAAQARAIWEKATGGKVPYDESMGRFYDMAHKTPIADGGSPRDLANLEPMLHSDHMDSHKEDFVRWGARSGGGTPGEPADVTIEPTMPVVEPPIIIDPIP